MSDETPLILPGDEHNRRLVENVHPAAWKNPEPATQYDLVVIGAGTAGLVAAAGAAGLGAKVALIERRLMGGDCLNVGCIPSKGMIRAARAAYDVRAAAEFGVICKEASLDFGKAMERMRRIRAGISIHDSAERFRNQLGVDVFFGNAMFAGPEAVEVGRTLLRFKKAAICTGARAAAPSVPGMEEAGYLTNETVFQLTELPRSLAVIGGGPIGCELAQAFSRMGSKVTVLQRGNRILPREDPDTAALIHRALVRDGVELRLQAKVVRATKRGKEKIVVFEQDGKSRELIVDEIMAGVGRTPNVEGLGLEQAGIAYDAQKGVLINDRLQTTNSQVYAAGDICSSYKFTHAADAMARIVIANALFGARQKASALVIPWCTYTDPEAAHVGMTGLEVTAGGIDQVTLTVPLSEVDRALLDGETDGFARVHLKKGTDKILGATIVARHAGEMINEFSLAMTSGLGLSTIAKTIHPYPTQAEAIKKLADAYQRTRLTPFIKKILFAWFRLWRK